MAKMGNSITPGLGIDLKITIGTATHNIGQIVDCPFPSVESADIDTSNHDSLWKTSLGGSKSVGNLTCKVKYSKDQYTTVLPLVGGLNGTTTGANGTILITLPPVLIGTATAATTQSFACAGRIKALPGSSVTIDDDIEHDLVIAFSGEPTVA